MRYEPRRDRRRNAWALILVTLAVVQLTRVSPRIAGSTGRPTVVERTIAALSGPVLRAGYRATDGVRELGLAVLFPRKLLADRESHEATANERKAASKAIWGQVEGLRLRSQLVTDTDQLTYQLQEGVPTRVIGRDPTGRSALLSLDRGATSGVVRGMSVSSGPDLIGIVDRVNRSTSVAYAVTDRRFSAEARSLRSGDYVGTVVGNGKGDLYIGDIAPGADLREGDVLVTAPTTEGPPPNLRLGVVERVGLERLSLAQGTEDEVAPGTTPYRLWALAVPAADIDAIREARIPARMPSTEDEGEEDEAEWGS